MGMLSRVEWPDGKKFAFTVFDDTDSATLANTREVYAFLADCGFRTTKSCWPVRGDASRPRFPGETCEDSAYNAWLLGLQSKGFEIGWHNATWHGLPRAEIFRAMDRFAEIFGHYPQTAANHSDGESLYWGNYRLTGFRAVLYDFLTFFRNHDVYRGHIESDIHFWGDLCKEKIKFFRNFVFHETNCLKCCPFMPYHDPLRPYVNYWFASCNGNRVNDFTRFLSEANQDRLEEEGGACIMYAHFARGFQENGRLQPRFRQLIERLAQKRGWFVPVATVMEYLLRVQGHHDITDDERKWLERRWLREKLFVGRV